MLADLRVFEIVFQLFSILLRLMTFFFRREKDSANIRDRQIIVRGPFFPSVETGQWWLAMAVGNGEILKMVAYNQMEIHIFKTSFAYCSRFKFWLCFCHNQIIKTFMLSTCFDMHLKSVTKILFLA